MTLSWQDLAAETHVEKHSLLGMIKYPNRMRIEIKIDST